MRFIALVLTGALANYITLSDRYTADPSPFVADGRLYIYSSHDLDEQRAWLMTDYSLMSTDDLTNWRDEGIVFDINNQTWGKYAWAQQVIEGPAGGYLMYFPAMDARANDTLRRSGVGVAFSPSPLGPFNDVLGYPLMTCGDDPTVFRDDDGQVYLCGNCNGPKCGKLSPNMPSFLAPPEVLTPALPSWFEAPWLSKHAGTYYLSYMCRGNGSTPFSHYGWDICYGSCDGPTCSPLGPYTPRGSLMWNPPNDCGPINATCEGTDSARGENNHQGIVEYPPHSGVFYFAYHSRTLSKSRDAYLGYQRNVAIDRLFMRSDASTFPLPSGLPWVIDTPGSGAGMVPVTSTPSWVRQLHYVDAFSRIPATLSAAMSSGLDTEPCSEGGRNLGFIADGATMSLRGVFFGTSADGVTLRIASPLSGSSVSIIADGALVGSCLVPNTGDRQVYANTSCTLAPPISGLVTNLTLAFHGPNTGGLFNLLFYAFTTTSTAPCAVAPTPPPVAVRVAIRATATGAYWAVGADGAVTAGGSRSDSSSAWVLEDQGDSTWALHSPSAEAFACVSSNGTFGVGPTSTAAPCTRIYLYGTTFGSYGVLSASKGLFVVASADVGAPLVASAANVQGVPADGARHWFEELGGDVGAGSIT